MCAVPKYSVEEKKKSQNKIKQLKISKKLSEKETFNVRTNHFVTLFCKFCKTNFFRKIPLRSELRNWLFRGTRIASEFFRKEILFPTLGLAEQVRLKLTALVSGFRVHRALLEIYL
jgi:hypothetical protein